VKRFYLVFLPLLAVSALVVFQFLMFQKLQRSTETNLNHLLKLRVAEIGKVMEQEYYCFRTEFEQLIPRDTSFYLINSLAGAKLGPDGKVNYGRVDTLNSYSEFDNTRAYNSFTFETRTRVIGTFNFEFLPISEISDSSDLSLDEAYILKEYKNYILNNEGRRLFDTLMLDSLIAHNIKIIKGAEGSFYELRYKDSIIYRSLNFVDDYDTRVKALLYQSNLLPEIQLLLYTPQSREQVMINYWPWILTLLFIVLILIYTYRRNYILIQNMKRLNAMKSDFINLMTHEFNTPLTNLKLTLEQYNDSLPVEKKHKLLSILHNEIDRIKNNFQTLFQINKLSVNELELNKELIPGNELVMLIEEVFEPSFEKHSVQLNIDLEPDDVKLNLDKAHMLNVLTNLVDNALKYGGEYPMINIYTMTEGQWFKYIIKDNGIGIKSDQLDYIFDKYYRSGDIEINSKAGMGLGLYFVKKVVELHGGMINVKSAAGKGTEIVISLPLKPRP